VSEETRGEWTSQNREESSPLTCHSSACSLPPISYLQLESRRVLAIDSFGLGRYNMDMTRYTIVCVCVCVCVWHVKLNLINALKWEAPQWKPHTSKYREIMPCQEISQSQEAFHFHRGNGTGNCSTSIESESGGNRHNTNRKPDTWHSIPLRDPDNNREVVNICILEANVLPIDIWKPFTIIPAPLSNFQNCLNAHFFWGLDLIVAFSYFREVKR
jgi:hypothetical protein